MTTFQVEVLSNSRPQRQLSIDNFEQKSIQVYITKDQSILVIVLAYVMLITSVAKFVFYKLYVSAAITENPAVRAIILRNTPPITIIDPDETTNCKLMLLLKI